jgi:hypothetical protein
MEIARSAGKVSLSTVRFGGHGPGCMDAERIGQFTACDAIS